MSIYIDRKFTLLLSPKLENFKQKNTNLFNFRCCICGDSQKNKVKSRGYIYAKGDSYFFACHNGCPGSNLYHLILNLDPNLAKEYLFENFSDKFTKKREPVVPVAPKFDTKPVNNQIDLPTIASLPDDNPARKYILGRNIPEKFHDELFYAEDFKTFAHEFCGNEFDKTSSRVIIPFYNKKKELIAFQARAIDASSIRYITIKLDNDNDKIFGLDKVNPNKKIYVWEGPIDSMFIPNSLATADSNLSIVSRHFSKDQIVLVPDFEPRNKNIVKSVGRWVDSGFNICFFPVKGKNKDINQMINDGYTSEQLVEIIDKHTFSGLEAQLEYIKWKKVD